MGDWTVWPYRTFSFCLSAKASEIHDHPGFEIGAIPFYRTGPCKILIEVRSWTR